MHNHIYVALCCGTVAVRIRSILSLLTVSFLFLQVSDWSQRPLTQRQLQYAALDAAVQLRLIDAMLQRTPQLQHAQSSILEDWHAGSRSDAASTPVRTDSDVRAASAPPRANGQSYSEDEVSDGAQSEQLQSTAASAAHAGKASPRVTVSARPSKPPCQGLAGLGSLAMGKRLHHTAGTAGGLPSWGVQQPMWRRRCCHASRARAHRSYGEWHFDAPQIGWPHGSSSSWNSYAGVSLGGCVAASHNDLPVRPARLTSAAARGRVDFQGSGLKLPPALGASKRLLAGRARTRVLAALL